MAKEKLRWEVISAFFYIYNIMANIDTFIELHNNGWFTEKVVPVFNNLKNFLRVVVNKKRQAELSLETIPDYEFWDDPTLFDFLEENGFLRNMSPRDIQYFNDDVHNVFLLWQLEKNPKETLEFICKTILRDVEFKNEHFYLHLSPRSELSELFSKSDRDRSLVRDLLEGDLWDVFSDTIWDNTYSQVIESLDESNLLVLKKYIMRDIGNVVLSTEDYESDFFHLLSERQGTEGSFEITNENVSELIKDETAMLELLDKELSELSSELGSVHYQAYNQAWIDGAERTMWDSLEEYFDTESWIHDEKTTNDGKKFFYSYIRIRDFYGVLKKFLTEHKIPEYSDSNLGYNSEYVGFLSNQMADGDLQWLRLDVDEWPDSDLLDELINDVFLEHVNV